MYLDAKLGFVIGSSDSKDEKKGWGAGVLVAQDSSWNGTNLDIVEFSTPAYGTTKTFFCKCSEYCNSLR